MPFTPADGVPCQLLPDGRLRVTAPVVWTGTRGDAVLIPAGTVSDLASVPRVARGLVDVGGPIGRAALVHDVLCDAANAWSRAVAAWDAQERANEAAGRLGRGTVTVQGPRPEPPRFLGPDIDGALRAAARDLQAATGERWLYWVAVRYGALFGSKGRRARWLSTLAPVLALTVPALLVILPAIVGALVARVLLVACELVAWPWTRTAPVLREPARQALQHAEGRPPRQLPQGAAQLAHAAALHGLDERRAPVVLPDPGMTMTPVGPTSGPQQVVRARRAAARQRRQGSREPAPWCATYLQACTPGCDPAVRCERSGDPANWLGRVAPCPRCGSYRCGCPGVCTCPPELVLAGRPHAPSCPYRPPTPPTPYQRPEEPTR